MNGIWSMMLDLKLSISTRVIQANDVARALVSITEHGIEGTGTSDTALLVWSHWLPVGTAASGAGWWGALLNMFCTRRSCHFWSSDLNRRTNQGWDSVGYEMKHWNKERVLRKCFAVSFSHWMESWGNQVFEGRSVCYVCCPGPCTTHACDLYCVANRCDCESANSANRLLCHGMCSRLVCADYGYGGNHRIYSRTSWSLPLATSRMSPLEKSLVLRWLSRAHLLLTSWSGDRIQVVHGGLRQKVGQAKYRRCRQSLKNQ